MEVAEYPQLTIIMRGYTQEQANAILKAMAGFETNFAVEVTLNTPHAIEQIRQLNKEYGQKVKIGAGTVRTIEDAKQAYEVGAQFFLGPHTFTKEMLKFANEHKVLAVPAAMTPSEVSEMFDGGADIVKIFPADVVTPRFFKDIAGPLGKLPLMAVGGVSQKNAGDFLQQGASYLGIGSGLFNPNDLKECAIENLANSLKELMNSIQ